MQLLSYHQRMLIRIHQGQPDYPDYHTSISTAKMQRWYPLYHLLHERFRGGKGFSDYEIGRLLRLREEYEGGFDRKG